MRELARRLPSAEMHVLDEVSHAAFWEAPAEWNAAALDFLTHHRTVPLPKRSTRK
jgi:pimeloyl-ACP methyl ester carboxylesterase